MGKKIDFFRDIITSVVDDRALNYGICKAVDILLDLKIEDEKIIFSPGTCYACARGDFDVGTAACDVSG